MATAEKTAKEVYYHIIWIPKFRKQLLVGKVAETLKTIINGQCQELSIQNLDN